MTELIMRASNFSKVDNKFKIISEIVKNMQISVGPILKQLPNLKNKIAATLSMLNLSEHSFQEASGTMVSILSKQKTEEADDLCLVISGVFMTPGLTLFASQEFA